MQARTLRVEAASWESWNVPLNHIYANVLVKSPYLRLTCANPDFWDLGCWNAEEQPGGVRKGPCSATLSSDTSFTQRVAYKVF